MNRNNNFNSQFNSMNNSSNNGPMQPVKNRFFNQDLFNDVDVDSVNSSTSSQVSNWGIGLNNQNDNTMMSGADFNNMLGPQQPVTGFEPVLDEVVNKHENTNVFASIFSQDLLEDVNGSVFSTETPEVLDDNLYVDNQSNNINNNTLFGYTENEVLESETESLDNVNAMYHDLISSENDVLDTSDINVGQGAYSPVFNQNAAVENTSVAPMIDNNTMAQQPLSLNSLGASPINQQPTPDVEDGSKYFPSPDPIIEKENELLEKKNKPPVDLMAPSASILGEEVIVIDETALIKAYVGKNYDKFMKSNFSGFAMFFGSLAFFCRSMYITGLIIFAFQIAVLFIFNEVPYIIVAIFIILSLIMALIINPLYFSLVKSKVKGIRKKHPKVSQGDLNNICAKRGKNNIVVALLLQVILVGVSVFMVIQTFGIDYFKDIYNDVLQIFVKKEEKKEFNGKINYNDLDIEEYFDITLPDGYKDQYDMNFSYSYLTDGVGENNTCSLKFGGVSGFKTSKELLENLADYYKITNSIDTVKFNGLDWYLLYFDTDQGKTYYRATDIDNNVLLFEFNSGAQTPVGVCDSHIVMILDSIVKK